MDRSGGGPSRPRSGARGRPGRRSAGVVHGGAGGYDPRNGHRRRGLSNGGPSLHGPDALVLGHGRRPPTCRGLSPIAHTMRTSWRLRDRHGVRPCDRLVHQPNETHAIHRGSERRTILVALVAIAFVAVAIAKPWGGSVPTSAPSASPTLVALTQASTSDAPQSFGPVETPSSASSATAPTTPSDPTFVPDVAPVIGGLDPGTYTSGDVDGQGFNVRFTVPAGWTWNGRYLSKGGVGLPDGAAIFFFGGPVHVYADPCDWAGAEPDPSTGLAVGDLMAALIAQPMRSATPPIERPAASLSLRGRWPGMAVELTVPDVNFAGCDEGQFRSWGPDNNARSHQGPGQRDLVWAVDLSGAGVDNGQGLIIVAPRWAASSSMPLRSRARPPTSCPKSTPSWGRLWSATGADLRRVTTHPARGRARDPGCSNETEGRVGRSESPRGHTMGGSCLSMAGLPKSGACSHLHHDWRGAASIRSKPQRWPSGGPGRAQPPLRAPRGTQPCRARC